MHNKYDKDETEPDMVVYITQIKEKYGTLRFYANNTTDEIDGAIGLAEFLSYKTCEFCGAIENVGRTKGWIYTICKDCFDKGLTDLNQWTSLEDLEKEDAEQGG